MILRAVLALLLSLPAQAAPLRVMSINVCTDSLLLDLLPPARIASVSWLARDPSLSVNWQAARAVPLNRGTVEDVLAQHPDLVLAGTYTTPATRALLTRLGIPMLVVPPAEDFSQIRAVTRTIAAALGQAQRGETLLARMDATLAALTQTRTHPAPTVLAWDGAGPPSAAGTLFDAILHAAGGINAATAGPADLEQVIWTRPDILAIGGSATATPGLRRRTLAEPVLRAAFHGRIIVIPAALYGCGVPETAQAAAALQAQLR